MIADSRAALVEPDLDPGTVSELLDGGLEACTTWKRPDLATKLRLAREYSTGRHPRVRGRRIQARQEPPHRRPGRIAHLSGRRRSGHCGNHRCLRR